MAQTTNPYVDVVVQGLPIESAPNHALNLGYPGPQL